MLYSVPVFLSRRLAKLVERARTDSVPMPSATVARSISAERRLKTANPPLRRPSRPHDRASNM